MTVKEDNVAERPLTRRERKARALAARDALLLSCRRVRHKAIQAVVEPSTSVTRELAGMIASAEYVYGLVRECPQRSSLYLAVLYDFHRDGLVGYQQDHGMWYTAKLIAEFRVWNENQKAAREARVPQARHVQHMVKETRDPRTSVKVPRSRRAVRMHLDEEDEA